MPPPRKRKAVWECLEPANPLTNYVTARWSRFSQPSDLDALLAALNVKGSRERLLHQALSTHRKRILEGMRRIAEELNSPVYVSTVAYADALAASACRELLKIDARLRVDHRAPSRAATPSLPPFSRATWQERVKKARTATDFGEVISAYVAHITPESFKVPWRSFAEEFHRSVRGSPTIADTMLHFLVFEATVRQKKLPKEAPQRTMTTRPSKKAHHAAADEDTANQLECFVCKDGGDLLCCDFCPLVYHTYCLSPPLAEIPEGDWKCPQCEKAAEKAASASASASLPPPSEYDLCRTCRMGGDLLWCDSCPNCYHLQCLSPPLAAPPEGDWFCVECCQPCDVVWVRPKGPAPWPAKVLDKQLQKWQVQVFGTHEKICVPVGKIESYESRAKDIPNMKKACEKSADTTLPGALDEVVKFVANQQHLRLQQQQQV